METTLIKGLQVLEALVASTSPRGVTDLAQELGLMKSNVHRLLKTLVHQGYVRQDAETGRYRCSPKLWELGARVSRSVDIIPVAKSAMTELMHATNETVHVAILDSNEVLYVSMVECPQPVRTFAQVGMRAPLYAVGTGKCILAHLDAETVKLILSDLKPSSPNTIVDPAALTAELQTIRTLGYGLNRAEWREGVGSVAAPIFDASSRVFAAIGVSGPLHRMTPERVKVFAPFVIKAAKAISREFGYSS